MRRITALTALLACALVPLSAMASSSPYVDFITDEVCEGLRDRELTACVSYELSNYPDAPNSSETWPAHWPACAQDPATGAYLNFNGDTLAGDGEDLCCNVGGTPCWFKPATGCLAGQIDVPCVHGFSRMDGTVHCFD